MDALQALTTRASPSQLAEPAPDDIAVEAMLRADDSHVVITLRGKSGEASAPFQLSQHSVWYCR